MAVIINGTTGISNVDGSAGAPAETGTDTDTGMWFPAANTVAWSTGGSERMRVDSSGNVGIGTTSPNASLGIARGAGVGATIELAGNGATLGTNSFLVGMDGASSAYVWNRANNIVMFGTNNTERMRIDSSGNVGIGTTTVTAKLNVQVGAVTTLGAQASSGLLVSGGGSNNNLCQIALGYGTTYAPVAISSITTTQTGNTIADLIFATRSVNTDTAPTERMRLDSSGNLLVGGSTVSGLLTVLGGTVAGTSVQAGFGGTNGTSVRLYHADTGGSNAAVCVGKFEKVSSNNRSINAAGTVNASGADYAEYMTKSGDFAVAKGDVVGINAEGKLTNLFANAVSFVVKSTDPSYVGNDKWGSDFEDDAEGLEQARALVDRIAFAGQVPVNVLGATAGQYIIPVNDNGLIKGEAVSNPTFEQYQIAVGKVIAIESDGRARIIVKVA